MFTPNFHLLASVLQTEAVTVTALGGKKQDRKLGYATSTVKGDELARTNTISPVNALQGKVAGLQISTSGSSGLTSSPVITLRGAKSLTKNNSPIFVIDGIVMENSVMGLDADGSNSGIAYGNQLKNLNSNDYESVTVLKGAAATALYGSRGANGAIVITTKGGKARKGVGIEVNYSHEFSQTYAAPMKLQNLYGMGSPTNGYEGDIIPNVGSTVSDGVYSAQSFGPRMDAGLQMSQEYKLGKYNNPVEPLLSYANNWKSIFQTGQQDNVSVALTGGSEKATYRVSYGYTNMKGALPNNEFKRHSVNVRTNGKINDVFSVDFSMQYSNSNTLNPNIFSATSGRSYAAVVSQQINRNTDLKWYRDNYIDYSTWMRLPDGSSTALKSIQSALNTFVDDNTNHNEQTIIASVGLTAQFNSWLDANARLTYNDYSYFNETKNYGSGFGRGGAEAGDPVYSPGGSYSIGGGKSGEYNFLGQLHSNNLFLDDNLELDVRLFYELYGNSRGSSWSKSTRGGLIVPGMWNFGNSAEPLEVSNYDTNLNYRNRMTYGIGGAVNLSWKDQINLEVTARNDWLSSLLYPTWIPQGSDNWSVFYPSVNLSWVFSDTFNIDPNILSYGKLRASWGQVGSGTSAYETASGAGGFDVKTESAPNGNNLQFATPNNSTLPNYDLKPEIQTSMEFGADLRFLNGRIGVDVAYYKINTRNQILKLDAVKESGVTKQLINAGNIQNQGWELQLDFRPIQTRTVRWEIGLNWSRNRSKIKEFYEGISSYKLFDNGTGGIPGIYAFENGAFGQIVSGSGYGYTSDGAGVAAVFRNMDDPNDPRNGKMLINYGGTTSSLNLPYYSIVRGSQVTNYYHGVLGKDEDGNQIDGYNTPGDKPYLYDVLGKVEPDFFAGLTTSLTVNLPNNSGSFDFFAQIDGRVGGHMISSKLREAMQYGNVEMSLYGRDEEHGGVARVNYKGETVYNGMIPDGVFYKDFKVTRKDNGQEVTVKAGTTFAEAVEAGDIEPMLSAIWYTQGGNYGFWGAQNINVSKATYFSLREVTLGYNFPDKWIKHVGLQSARLSFSGRNLCYIYNGMRGGINPESISSNNPLTPVDYGGVPYARNFSINLNLRF
ncbi:SusC/RagA family TonB-linked outer membrane protein [uncultured Rikenella sp.]|uniref:SusC/RagA family TonB-linked outer membrane protein n=1 Tax=uncultured Rikenella sp. TaxID=368003 RepID=UPI002605F94E|nr:SusC/RagA family TonB-linked outer membrane protein [uncultured Rikenella sp.]